MNLREFGAFKELPHNIDYKEFRKFVNDCWVSRYTLYDDSSLLEECLENKREQRFLTFDGNCIKARNYVGFISYEGQNITVYPKIFHKNIDDNDMDKYLLINLIYWLKRSDRIKLPLIDSSIDFDNMESFIEILIYIFSEYTSELIYKKPFNRYEEVEEELEFLKGRLNTSSYIKENLSTGTWNKFNCTYEPFKYNNKFNQIIKFVGNMLLKVTRNSESIKLLQKINFILDEVDDVNCTVYDCNKIKLSRLQDDYNMVLKFCEMFLGNSCISRNNDQSKLNFCFLVPMEILFEDFVFNFIKDSFSKELKEVTKQKSNLYLSDLYVNDSFLQRAFNLRQDIFIKDLDDNILILDTKYKVLDTRDKPKIGINQGDMYQMASYALRGGYQKLALIYPRVKGFEDSIKYVIKSPFMDDKIEIDVHMLSFVIDYDKYISIENPIDLYAKNDTLLYEKVKSILINQDREKVVQLV